MKNRRWANLSAMLAVMIFQSMTVSAAPQIDARVLSAGTYGSGVMFVILDTSIQEPGCVSNRFHVPADHPQLKNWLAIAVAAATSHQRVRVKTSGCTGAAPIMNETTDSYFYIFSD